jgi:hypothetical protein
MATPSRHLVYQLPLVHYLVIRHAFSFRGSALLRRPTGRSRSAAAQQQVGYEQMPKDRRLRATLIIPFSLLPRRCANAASSAAGGTTLQSILWGLMFGLIAFSSRA